MSEFVLNIAKISSGQIIAQIIAYIAIPIITRLYSPEQYGVFAIYLSMMMMMAPIMPLRFNYALMLPEEKKQASNLMILAFISIVVIFILLSGIAHIMAFYELMPNDWLVKGFQKYIIWVPLGCTIIAFNQTLISWALRNRRFNIISFARILDAFSDKSFVLLLGYFLAFGASGLIIGKLSGSMIATLLILYMLLWPEKKKIIEDVNILSIKQLSKRYKEYHLLATMSLFLSKFAREMPLLLMGTFFGLNVAAFYAFTLRIINMPISLIGDAIANVFFKETTELKNNNLKLIEITEKLLCAQIYITLPIIVISYCYAGKVIEIVFGPEWKDAGMYVQILIFGFVGFFLHKTISTLYDTFELQRAKIFFDLNILVMRILSIIVGAFIYHSLTVTLWSLSMVSLVLYTCSTLYVLKRINMSYSQLLIRVGAIILKLSPLVLAVVLSRYYYNYINTWNVLQIGTLLFLQLLIFKKSLYKVFYLSKDTIKSI